jgi:pyruvate dehydrogenase E2 component (dihydrolipoamide acetyltransferase)
MPIEILMPALSPTMTEGNLAKWLKKEGDKVSSGDILAEIETDKAIMEVEAIDDGIIGKIIVPAGTNSVAVNQLIALILEEGEDASLLDKYTSNSNLSNLIKPTPESAKVVEIIKSATQTITSTATDKRIMASPLAKRIASDKNIDLAGIAGSGPHGRIIRDDVLEALSNNVISKPTASIHGARASEESSKIPHTMMRKVIAKRLSESKQTVPHFYLNIECNIDKLNIMRNEINANTSEYKLSINDFIIKASAMSLKLVPEANASWSDEAIIQYHNIDVAVAVALDEGLITPIIRNTDQKSLSTISMEMKALAAKAKASKLTPEEFQGGGFSISNLGMYGIKNFNAIINAPQSCILAVGTSNQQAVVINNQISIATIMQVTLSSDHRVVDGAVGAKFLHEFKKFIENPMLMLV